MRWLHNRSLHAWGIAFGLAVTGEERDAVVTVEPGYAIDSQGRELILRDPLSLTVPAIPGEGTPMSLLVTISYPKPIEVTWHRPGVCQPGGAARYLAAPQIRWLESRVVRPGFDLVLAQARIENCRLARPLTFVHRRSARPASQPYIASGHTDPQATGVEVNEIDGTRGFINLDILVDTASAHFHTTPRYLVQLASSQVTLPLLVGQLSISDARPTSFRLTVPVASGQNQDGYLQTTDNRRATRGWHVVWMGIEGG